MADARGEAVDEQLCLLSLSPLSSFSLTRLSLFVAVGTTLYSRSTDALSFGTLPVPFLSPSFWTFSPTLKPQDSLSPLSELQTESLAPFLVANQNIPLLPPLPLLANPTFSVVPRVPVRVGTANSRSFDPGALDVSKPPACLFLSFL